MTTIQSKRILIITPFAQPNIGGVETHIKLLCDYLRQHAYKTTILTYKPLTTHVSALSCESENNLTIYRFSWLKGNLFSILENYPVIFNFLYLTPYLFLRSLLFMIFHWREVETIHVFGLNAGIIGRILKFLFRKRVVMSIKGIYGFYPHTLKGGIIRWVIGGLDAVLVGSLDSKEDFLNLGINSDKLTLFTHWIDHGIFKSADKSALRRQLGWGQEFTVIYAGRLIPQKGILTLIKTAHSLPKIKFKIIGDGIANKLVADAAKHSANVEFLGNINYQDIGVYIGAADVFVYPAQYHDDVSLATLEALACGTPVISSNRGSGVYRLTEDFSIVIKPTVDQLKEKIEWLRDHPAELATMSKNAINFAKQFNSELAKAITATYQ